jgi:peptidyl-prolyl cis-trans isomerase D
MFDLFRSRAKAVRYLLGALLVLVALSMVITLIPGFGTGMSSSDNIVAEIGDEALTALEVQQSLQMQLRGRSIPPQLAAVYVPQLVDQMISERAIAYEAERQGFQVTEQDLATTIESIFPQLFEGGKFAGKEAYAAILGQNNMTIPQFETNLRKQLLLNRLRSLALEGTVVPPSEVEEEYRRRNEKVKIEYVAISPAKFHAEIKLTPEEIQDHFQKNRATFRISEKRSFDMLVVSEAAVAASIAMPDAELRRAYELNKEAYRTPERVKVRHILLKTTDKPKEEVPKIRARIEDLLKQLQKGADFADLARKNSEDPGSGVKGGDLDWIVRGQTVKAFEDTAFSLKPNQLSNVITTEYGFHVIQVQDKQQAGLRPFEEVKAQLADERKRQLVFDRMQTLSDQARAALNKDPQGAEQTARSLGIPFVKVEQAGAGDPIPQIGVSREIEDAITGLRKGEVSSVVQVPGNRLVVTVVREVHPSRPAELPEVEAQIRNQLTEQKGNQIAEQKAREALDKAKAAGDLKKVAQALGIEWKAPPEFGRSGAAEGLGAASYLEEAFTRSEGDVFGPVQVNNQQYVCKVVAKIPADMMLFAAQRDELVQQVKGNRSRERLELFEEGVKNRLIQDKKVKIHQDVINRIVSGYRGA